MLDWLAAQAQAKPGGVALSYRNQTWTYADLNREVDELCSRLAGLQMAPDARVAVLMHTCPGYVTLVHTLARLGLVLAPLNTRLTEAELRQQIERLRPACLIAAPEWSDLFQSENYPALSFDELSDRPKLDFEPVPFELGRLQGLLFTSGTAGSSKAVRLTFGNHFWSAFGSASRLGMFPEDRWLSGLPFYHVGALAVLFRACLAGSTVLLVDGFDIDAIAADQTYTSISLVPTMLYRLLEANYRFPPSVRLILLGGASASLELLAEAHRRHLPVATTYGLTEAASQAATMTPAESRRKQGSVGKPLLFTQIRIVDDAGQKLPAGEPGEITLCGPTIMEGYEGDPEATAKALRDGWLYTGDVGYIDDEGDLWVLQRRSDLIVSGGENIYPAEVEAALRSHPDVQDACVVGVPDQEWGQRVAAAVVLRAGRQLSQDELLAFTRQSLAGYKQPRLIRYTKWLPVGPSGKVERRRVQQWLVEAYAGDQVG